MKIKKLVTILCLSTLVLQAQDITNKLGGDTATETYDVTDSGDNLLFRVQGDKGALFTGEFGATGVIPATGAGTRMMWYPAKAAFRVGYVDGTHWDAGNIGNYSIAMGRETTASGLNSTAIGRQTTASGDYSIAMGGVTTASGEFSTAMGAETTASGNYSIAMGGVTTASGLNSTAMGRAIEASGDYTVAIALNDQNGTNVTQANTMAIMGGKVGIGTASPGATLSIVGLSEYADNAAALVGGLIAGDLYRTGDLLKIVH